MASGKNTINSVEYWNRRFEADWTERDGPNQTRFFAKIVVDNLPGRLARRLKTGSETILDIGCALGDASEIFKSAFPKISYIGVDVSDVAVQSAKKRYPGGRFATIKPAWDKLPKADIIVTSNTLEHLTDWTTRINRLCASSAQTVVILVPYEEKELEPEHVTRFNERVFPVRTGGMALEFMRVIGTTELPDSRWKGSQILVIYSRETRSLRRTRRLPAPDLMQGIDVRGLSEAEIDNVLLAAERPKDRGISTDDILRINQEWKDKFETMVRAFEEKILELNSSRNAAMAEADRNLQSVTEAAQQERRQLVAERDEAVRRATAADETRSGAEALHAERVAQMQEFSRVESEIQRKSLDLEFEKRLLSKDRAIELLTAKIENLETLLQQERSQQDQREIDSRALLDKHATEIAGSRRVIEDLRLQISAEAINAAANNELRTAFENLQSEYASKLARLEAEVRRVEDREFALKRRHETEVAELEKELRSARTEKGDVELEAIAQRANFAKLSESFAIERATLSASHSDRLARHVTEHAAELSSAKAKIAFLEESVRRQEAQRAIDSDKHASEVEHLRNLNSDAAARFSRDLTWWDGAYKNLEAENKTLANNHAEQLQRLQNEHMDVLGGVNAKALQLEGTIRDLEKRNATDASQSSVTIDRLRGEIVQLERESRLEIDTLRAGLAAAEIDRAELIRIHANEIDALRHEHAGIIADLNEEIVRIGLHSASEHAYLVDHAARLARANKTLEIEQAALAQLHALEQNRLQENHARELVALKEEAALAATSADQLLEIVQAEVARLTADLNRLEEERDNIQAERQAHAEALETALANERLLEENLSALREHYERHLEAINLYVDRVGSEVARALREVNQAHDAQVDELTAIAANNIDVGRSAFDRVQNKSLYRVVRAKFARLLGRPTFQGASPAALPRPLPSVQALQDHPDMVAVRHALNSLAYAHNLAGASDFRGHQVLAPEMPPPANVVPLPTDLIRQHGSNLTVAMQLEHFDKGGLEKVVFDLCCGFVAVGIPTIVICKSGGFLAEKTRAVGIKVFEFRDVDEYRNVIVQNNVTHIFSHHSYFGFEYARQIGVKMFDVVHNYYLWKLPQRDRLKEIGIACAGVICVSTAVRDFHARSFGIPRDKTRVICNAINLDGLIVPDAEQLLKVRAAFNQTTFLSVANFYPAKAQLSLVAAFAEAYKMCPEIKLLMAGEEANGEIAEEVRRFIEAHNLQNTVTVLGHCDRRELSRHYSQSHAFVLPSIYEGYSVSAIEAATFGLPLIMTDVGGARDLIIDSDCGILLPPIVEDLANCSPADVEEISRNMENRTTPRLIEAFVSVARNRNEWSQKGLLGMTKPKSLQDMVLEYISVITESDRPASVIH